MVYRAVSAETFVPCNLREIADRCHEFRILGRSQPATVENRKLFFGFCILGQLKGPEANPGPFERCEYSTSKESNAIQLYVHVPGEPNRCFEGAAFAEIQCIRPTETEIPSRPFG